MSDKSVTATFNLNSQTLSVTKAGQAPGTIDSSPAGINCPGTCSASFTGTVTLNAHPGTGATFMGWSGACSGTGVCPVNMSAARSVTATFGYNLTIQNSGIGQGTVSSSDGAINWCSSCTKAYATPTAITLHPAPAAGSTFVAWSGACGGTADCALTTNAARTVTANFGKTLTVSRNGTGTGTVASSDGSINCGADCTSTATVAKTVTLTATPGAGSTFAGWSGACSGTGSCSVSLNSSSPGPSVTATFNGSYTLSVTKSGTGSGTVTSSPPGINCGVDCNESFAPNSQVTLVATAASGSSFTGWGGACSGTGGCTVTMSASRSVIAYFSASQPNLVRLTVVKTGSGAGTVTGLGGINCGAVCSATFSPGSIITLNATPDTGSAFKGWDPSWSSTTACTFALSADLTVTARFDLGNSPGAGACVPSPTTLCVLNNRFRVEVSWADSGGNHGSGHVVDYHTSESGLFWFFGPTNWELMVKVLDACPAPFNRFWVFSAATTTVQYTLTVTDTLTGQVKQYTNPMGVSAAAVTDTDAFDTCP